MIRPVCLAALLLMGTGLALAQTPAPADREHTERTLRFKQIDKNNDGKLTVLEFQTRPSNATPAATIDAATMASRAERFKQLDKNADGFLDFEEFKATETTPPPRAP
jgi:Ca2+-binding EF-hand superfamily protein